MEWTIKATAPKPKTPRRGLRKSPTTKPLLFGGCMTPFAFCGMGGGLLCFSRWDVQQVFMDAMRLAGFKVKSVLVWDRMHHGMGDLKGSFAPRYDTCIFAVKGRYILPNGRPDDVIQCQRLNGAELVHPNEKPVGLLRQLIEATTVPGQIILEPFAGSGSTLVAAALTGRQYIGVELDAEYHTTAQQRTLEAMKTYLLGGTL
ncbi:hypothetical protein LJC34_02645 [Oscillospiraceae bacterium OttesenSCG-928-G22]|nr:hypothetical protein [Oscillospiraceae bacterium OttesenSCG-928-G22]